MTVFQVHAFGDVKRHVRAESKAEAREKVREVILEEYDSTVSVTEYRVFKVQFYMDGTHANVLATSGTAAAAAAHRFIKNKVDRAIEGSTLNQDARDLFADIRTDVEVIEEVDNDYYEITPSGEWIEGSIEDMEADPYLRL